jgi:SNF2-related domain/Helicase conserved C-terminal domain
LKAVRHKNYAIFMEPRLGKTKVAIDVANIWALKDLTVGNEEEFRVLVLAPKIALGVWEEELEKHCTLDYSIESFQWYEGDGETLQFFLAGREETMRASRSAAGKLVRKKQGALELFDPDLIIIDESHEYKRPGGRGAQDAWKMVRRLRKRRGDGRPYVLLLSGTPNPKGWRDVFAQFRIMDDSILGTNVQSFDEDYVTFGHGPRRFSVVSYRNTRPLLRKIRAHSIAVSAEEAGLAGRQNWNSIRVDLPNAVSKIYQKFSEDMIVQLEGGGEISAKNSGVRRLRCLQIAGGFLTDGTQLHDAKIQATKEWLRVLLEQEEHCIVYARFLPEVQALGEVAELVGYSVGVIQGSTPQLDRVRYIKALQRGKRPTVLVFQIQTGKQSIELSTAAEVVYYSTPDGWVEYWQSLNRVRGPNQKRPVRYTHILARSTVDVSAMAGLRNKEDAHQTMMRNPRRYLQGMI